MALVVFCALLFVVLATRGDPQQSVLALSRDVAAGQVLTADDLIDVAVSGDASTKLVPAGQKPDWVGRKLTGPLPAGQLLTPSNLGPPAWPPVGQAVVAVAVPAGRLPAGVVPGSDVRVVVGGRTGPAGSSAGVADVGAAGATSTRLNQNLLASVVDAVGTATSVSSDARSASSGNVNGPVATGDGGAVLSLLMSAQDAAVVAASSTDGISVILQSPETGG